MTDRRQPPAAVVDQVRAIVCALPHAQEHQAWTGTSWRVANTTFTHIIHIADGWPPAYANAFNTDGPATVITFQAESDERHALAAIGDPYHLPPWRPGIVGITINSETDWTELAELLTDSHRLCSAKKPPQR